MAPSNSTLPSQLCGQDLEQRSVNAIRVLAMDAVQKANSGHPGAPLGMADLAYVLWSEFLAFDAEHPQWPNRDRFILSAGHACMLQYALLHLTGYALPLAEILNFRQWGSMTPGHPEVHHTPGVETTTGPLGQGLATAVGFAMAEAHLAARLNTPDFAAVDHFTYVIASDGDMMEGVQSEAASFAGHVGLGKLVVLYDDNKITIDGTTELAFSTEDVGARYAAYGWHVQRIDGHDRVAIAEAIRAARKTTDRPSLICARTHIGAGAPTKQDTSESHGSPLGAEEIAGTKVALGWPSNEPFFIPEEVRSHYRKLGQRGRPAREQWEAGFATYRQRHPERAALWDALHTPKAPGGTRPEYKPGDNVPTRKASGKALGWLLKEFPGLIGGSADLTPSNNTQVGEDAPYSASNPAGRYVHYGIREHAMTAIMNGIALHGGLIPYGGTFLVFADYLRPSLRLAALMGTKIICVFTHDSILLGEDGPTHQPIATLASLRAIPGLTVLRPADANETVAAWDLAITRPGPVALALTRQDLPVLDFTTLGARADIRRGAYVLLEPANEPELILFATGSEVAPAVDAAQRCNASGAQVRVVAVPSWEIFSEQDPAYQRSVMAPQVTQRVAVEAASPFGWERFVGLEGTIIGINRFGASAPWKVLRQQFGLDADGIEAVLRRHLDRS